MNIYFLRRKNNEPIPIAMPKTYCIIAWRENPHIKYTNAKPKNANSKETMNCRVRIFILKPCAFREAFEAVV